MKIFDQEYAAAIIAPLKAKLNDCAHGEGTQCEKMDAIVHCCADVCFDMAESIRDWAADVFSGDAAFDPVVESLWRTEGQKTLNRAVQIWNFARKAEAIQCFDLPAINRVGAGLWELNWLLTNWVRPAPSISPSARFKRIISTQQAEKMGKELDSLPA